MISTGGNEQADVLARSAAPPRGHTDADLMASVGRNLASVYADVLGQPMPPRIADLIERLADATETRRGGRAGGEA